MSWNSQSMLAESIPPLLEAIRADGGNHEVIVMDNHSTDGTDDFIRRHFPEVRLVSNKENIYFGAGTRLGIQAATRDILVLMNSDVIVRPGFLEPLLRPFADADVFGVASAIVGDKGEIGATGNTRARFNGRDLEWQHHPLRAMSESQEIPVFWLHRGLFAVDRRKYLWLGGLDGLYDPIHMEDVDLSYRAWKAGWKCLLAPRSLVSHYHQRNVPAAAENFIHLLVRRNQYIFFWKNINDLSMLASSLLQSTPTRLRRARLREIGVWREAQSFLGALKRLPVILARRMLLTLRIVNSDREVFSRVTGTGEN